MGLQHNGTAASGGCIESCRYYAAWPVVSERHHRYVLLKLADAAQPRVAAAAVGAVCYCADEVQIAQ